LEVKAGSTYGGLEMQIHAFLTLALDGDEWSDLCPTHFTPGKIHPGNHWSALERGVRLWKRENSLALVGKLTPISQPSSQ
jgi:hypothetical protein